MTPSDTCPGLHGQDLSSIGLFLLLHSTNAPASPVLNQLILLLHHPCCLSCTPRNASHHNRWPLSPPLTPKMQKMSCTDSNDGCVCACEMAHCIKGFRLSHESSDEEPPGLIREPVERASSLQVYYHHLCLATPLGLPHLASICCTHFFSAMQAITVTLQCSTHHTQPHQHTVNVNTTAPTATGFIPPPAQCKCNTMLVIPTSTGFA